MTHRRAPAVALAAGALAVAIALLGTGGCGKSGGGHPAATTSQLPRTLTLRVRNVIYSKLGLAFAQPLGWARSRRGGAIVIRSRDHTTAVTISSPTHGDFARLVQADSLRTLLRDYAPARVIGRRPGRLGRSRSRRRRSSA